MIHIKTLEYYRKRVREFEEKYKMEYNDKDTLQQMLKSMDNTYQHYSSVETFNVHLRNSNDERLEKQIRYEVIPSIVDECAEEYEERSNWERNITLRQYLEEWSFYKLARWFEEDYIDRLEDAVEQLESSEYGYSDIIDNLRETSININWQEIANLYFKDVMKCIDRVEARNGKI